MFPDGYFPRGRSVLRMVMDEKCVGLLYGQRALCIGALKPLNYVGTSEHTHHKQTPFKRLTHTGEMFERVFFGDTATADRTLRAVAGMHRRVNGELPEDAGPAYPRGARYDAFDPTLMWWTVAVMIDSARWFYEHLVRPLTADERDSFYADWVRFAALFGMPAAAAPADWPAFERWYAAQLAGGDLFLTDEARRVGFFSAFEIPMALPRRLAKPGHDALVLYSLPPRVRELYGLRLHPLQAAAVRALLVVHPHTRRVTPDRFALGSCVPELRAVAATERRRVERGASTPRVTAR